MYKKNKSEFDLINIPAWHDAGYTGKGIKFMELEGANPKNKQFDGMLTNDFKDWKNEKDDYLENSHGSHVFDVFHQIAPDAEMYVGSPSTGFMNGVLSGRFIEETVPYIKKKGIHVVAASLGGNKYQGIIDAIRDLKENYNVTFITSAGNEGECGAGDYAKTEEWINVGAVHYNERDEEIVRPYYSSVDEVLTLTMPSHIYVQSDKDDDYWFPLQGTSFSSPVCAATKCVVADKCLHEYGRIMTQKEFVNFVIDNVVDLGEKGHDKYYGHGLFVLPDPNTDLSKYFMEEGNRNKNTLSSFLDDNEGKTIDSDMLKGMITHVDNIEITINDFLNMVYGSVIDEEVIEIIKSVVK